jgi:Family of unknown function (DUF6085)
MPDETTGTAPGTGTSAPGMPAIPAGAGDGSAGPFPVAAMDLLESAWGIIANASQGEWPAQAGDWQQAASAWRERYHAALREFCGQTASGPEPAPQPLATTGGSAAPQAGAPGEADGTHAACAEEMAIMRAEVDAWRSQSARLRTALTHSRDQEASLGRNWHGDRDRLCAIRAAAQSTDDRAVAGYCPHGCGRTLFLADGGVIVCSYLHCPQRDAVADLLADCETEHVVWFGEGTFTIRHPLRERLGDDLVNCALHEHVSALDGPPVRPGKYRAARDGEHWTWTPVSGEAVP